VFRFATFVAFNNSAAEDVATSPISCPMLFNACRYLWKQGGLGDGGGGGDFNSPVLLFSLFFLTESEAEAEPPRVKWRVFRMIDSWPPAPRVTSQVYFSIMRV